MRQRHTSPPMNCNKGKIVVLKYGLMIFLLSAPPVFCVLAQKTEGVNDFFEHKGPPQFTAKLMESYGNLLVCRELNPFDADKGKAAKKLRGFVLLYCEPWDGIWLWLASTEAKMRIQTPLLGYEGPGVKFLDAVPPKNIRSTKLLKPARVFAAYIDERGRVSRTAEITVHKLQCND